MMKHDFRWTPPTPEHHVVWTGPVDNAELEAILNSTYPGTWTVQVMPPEYPIEAVDMILNGASWYVAERNAAFVLGDNGPHAPSPFTLPYPVEWRQ